MQTIDPGNARAMILSRGNFPVTSPRIAIALIIASTSIVAGACILRKSRHEFSTIPIHSEIVDLGQIGQSDLVPFKFPVRNIGDKTINIISIQTSCGCTILDDPSGVNLSPGGTLAINGSFDAKGKRGQAQSLSILSYRQLEGSSSEVRRAYLQVKANVQPTLSLSSEQIDIKDLLRFEAGDEGDYTIKVSPAIEGEFKLLGSSASVDWVKTTVLKSTCSRKGAIVDPAVVKVLIDSDSRRTEKALTRASAEVYLHSDCSDEPTLVIPLITQGSPAG